MTKREAGRLGGQARSAAKAAAAQANGRQGGRPRVYRASYESKAAIVYNGPVETCADMSCRSRWQADA